jgi:hypothetical protein
MIANIVFDFQFLANDGRAVAGADVIGSGQCVQKTEKYIVEALGCSD